MNGAMSLAHPTPWPLRRQVAQTSLRDWILQEVEEEEEDGSGSHFGPPPKPLRRRRLRFWPWSAKHSEDGLSEDRGTSD